MKTELLAPVNDFATLSAAIDAGANAVYFGCKVLNMRAGARNFETGQLKKVVKKCHDNGVLAYLTLNTIVFEDELHTVDKVLKAAKDAGVDAIIAWDFAVLSKARSMGFELHISTQAGAANSESLQFYEEFGAKRVVLARECSLEQIKAIKRKTKLEIECFVHGAMCISVSGRCYMSQFSYGCSANRGECIQPCRREYKVTDTEEGKEYIVNGSYIFSPKDLCTIKILDRILPHMDVLKIEGRMKGAEYIKTVVSCYKKAIELVGQGKFGNAQKEKLYSALEGVFNRGFCDGFYLNKPMNEWAKCYGSKAKKSKVYLGEIVKVYRKAGAVDVKLETGCLKLGQNILIIGEKCGCIEMKVESLQEDVGKNSKFVSKGKVAGLKVEDCSKIRAKDKVFLY